MHHHHRHHRAKKYFWIGLGQQLSKAWHNGKEQASKHIVSLELVA